MAGSTFLDLTNQVLRRLNEVQLTTTSFAQARNTQAMAQDAVIAAVAEINTKETQWPWNKQAGTVLATNTTNEFTWPTDQTVPNWDSFYIVGVPATAISTQFLENITQEEYWKYLQGIAKDSTPSGGQQMPKYVYPTVGGFGVVPMPEQDYTINYEYYSTPAKMVAYNDVCSIPDVYDYVIVNFALKHYYMYKDNTEQATTWKAEADKSFRLIQSNLVKRDDYAWSNMVNYGGMRWRQDYTKL